MATTERRRRGIARASITRLEERILKLEEKEELKEVDQFAVRRLIKRLESLDAEFKEHHLALVDKLEDDERKLDDEQIVLDEHDDKVSDFMERLLRLESEIKSEEVKPAQEVVEAVPDSSQHLLRRLQYVERKMRAIHERLEPMAPVDLEVCFLQHLEGQVNRLETDLATVAQDMLSLERVEETLSTEESRISDGLFTLGLRIKRLLKDQLSNSQSSPIVGIRLPKLSVPSFDGNILNWGSFWEQFDITIHSKEQITDAEKLAYLKDALKDGPAKNVIKGLGRTSENYTEAIKYLKERYDRPRLIHQAHVRAILEAPTLKDGNGRELRHLHDVLAQNVRALVTMKLDSFESFVTSVVELKLDPTTLFEWQRCSQENKEVPHYTDLLNFLDLRARASENTCRETERKRPPLNPDRKFTAKPSYAISTDDLCTMCKADKHPLFACGVFQALAHDKKMAHIRENGLCLNCLRTGHLARQCTSAQRCKKCRRPHHTLLHVEAKEIKNEKPTTSSSTSVTTKKEGTPIVATHVSGLGNNSQVLLMTCQVQVIGPNGYTSKARALLDSASSSSFITERLAQHLRLPRRKHSMRITGIGGTHTEVTPRGVVSLSVSRMGVKGKTIDLEALVLPKVTSDLPAHPVPFHDEWKHLSNIALADPDFGVSGPVDLLLGTEVFSRVVLHGRRYGPPGSPSAFKTHFGWVLAGPIRDTQPPSAHMCCFASEEMELLKKFWEVESHDLQTPVLSVEEKSVVQQFERNHSKDVSGRYVVPLPVKEGVTPLGESRSQAVKRFVSLERTLHSKAQFDEFKDVMEEYFEMGHAEPVPISDMKKPFNEIYYLPMHVVRKEDRTTSKLRIVFDASAKTMSGASLNDQLLVGPTVHAPLIDVLLRFRRHKVALTTDVSKMYRAIMIPSYQKDLHRFVWRKNPHESIRDFRMTRLTFGALASSFAANMVMKHNAIQHAKSHPRASQAVLESFYVDDGLLGADSIQEAIDLRHELQDLFDQGGFTLRKWKSSESDVLSHIPLNIVDPQTKQKIGYDNGFSKVLGVEWNATIDSFRPVISMLPSRDSLTKRELVSDIAKLFDVLGWCSPAIIKPKVLLQRLWERNLEWDEPVPQDIREIWSNWRSQLHELRDHLIPRSYFPKDVKIKKLQLHGFCDASEIAYAGVVYLRAIDSNDKIHTSLVIAKTKVAPIKRLTIPRLELCGAVILTRLLDHVARTLVISLSNVYAWTDSMVVLGWLQGNPRRFKTFVGNRVAEIIDVIPPARWRHVSGMQNPADCASRGLFPAELAHCREWWHGPTWLRQPEPDWPTRPELPEELETSEERKEQPGVTLLTTESSLPLLERISSYIRLRRVTAWIFRFIGNCRNQRSRINFHGSVLSMEELTKAETYWCQVAQRSSFFEEISALKEGRKIRQTSRILTFHPFVDDEGILRVGGRTSQADLPYSRRHPVLLPGNHALTTLIINSEHLRLLHAGPTLVSASLSRRFCILNSRRVIRSIVRRCVTCRRIAARPKPQLIGQLPTDRLNPGSVFDRVGIDYAGPILVKSGPIRKPIMKKVYVAVFVCFSTKAVHLEAVSDLTTVSFLATLRRFVGRRGLPSVLWSDHGTNLVGAAKEIRQMLRQDDSNHEVSEFCTTRGIQWKFTPEHAPHFGGLWEAAVKSFKTHLRKTIGEAKLNFEELTTVLVQIEACLNSRPLTPLPDASDEYEALTPGHFLIGKPLTALPDHSAKGESMSLLKRWRLCQILVRHFWSRWSLEYLSELQRAWKWHTPSRNLKVGDIVCLREEPMVPTKWPLARVTAIHPGHDGRVRVVTVKTSKGTYKRPIVKIVPLIYLD